MKPKSAPMFREFTEGEIDGVVIRDLEKFSDARGWLIELFRQDQLRPDFAPAMAYISITDPGVTRGPHEHKNQSDYFCFPGPSNFKLRMWDTRRESPTFGNVSTLIVGADNPKSILIPKGIVHGYRNVGAVEGMVINCPDRLYMGQHKSEPVDEVRHEDDPNTVFRV